MTELLNYALLGAIAMTSLAIGVFFLRFYFQGGDRFFLLFALSFFVQALNRAEQAMSFNPSEGSLSRYGVRLIAFTLILAAIADKNRWRRRAP